MTNPMSGTVNILHLQCNLNDTMLELMTVHVRRKRKNRTRSKAWNAAHIKSLGRAQPEPTDNGDRPREIGTYSGRLVITAPRMGKLPLRACNL